MFSNIGMMAWYKDEPNIFLDLLQIDNEYIEYCKHDSRTRYDVKRFTKENVVTKAHLSCKIY